MQDLKDDVKEYGKDAFVFEILHDSIIPELLDSYETEAIAKHNTVAPNGYNQNGGGTGIMLWILVCKYLKHTKAKSFLLNICQKMSEARKGEKGLLVCPKLVKTTPSTV